ncbi:MAG TPA: glutathione S-transferase [Alphaproteobacteria bacterium]|nr:glutathione S-transferase [Alphaproteobacteria bacterium]HAJ47299.1 glutathione S-transferase [Alphaproteobacteria bacterium]
MHTLYQFHLSGNCYKVRLTARHASIPIALQDVDIIGGETRGHAFLKLNPNGRVPTLVLEDGRALPESNAIMWFLAEDTALLPADKWARAQILQWLFFEQYSHEPYIATRRYWVAFAPLEARKTKDHMLQPWLDGGYAALGVMEQHLAAQDWFAAGQFTIADIALYAYTHVAHEGGFDLKPYPAVLRWLDRVARQPGHMTIAARA